MKYTITINTTNSACMQLVMDQLDSMARNLECCDSEEMQYHYTVDEDERKTTLDDVIDLMNRRKKMLSPATCGIAGNRARFSELEYILGRITANECGARLIGESGD